MGASESSVAKILLGEVIYWFGSDRIGCLKKGRKNGAPCRFYASREKRKIGTDMVTHAAKKKSRWSARVTARSDALDLEPKVFRWTNPRRIALSLKRSAETSKRRKGTPYQSAMSMLNFYINRAGKNVPKTRKRVLERAKDELRDVFGRD